MALSNKRLQQKKMKKVAKRQNKTKSSNAEVVVRTLKRMEKIKTQVSKSFNWPIYETIAIDSQAQGYLLVLIARQNPEEAEEIAWATYLIDSYECAHLKKCNHWIDTKAAYESAKAAIVAEFKANFEEMPASELGEMIGHAAAHGAYHNFDTPLAYEITQLFLKPYLVAVSAAEIEASHHHH